MKASTHQVRWASLAEAVALVSLGWRILSYGSGPESKSVLLTLGA